MAVGLAGAMNASAINLTFVNVSPEENINLQITGAISFSSEVQAGIYNLIVDGVATPSLCIDVGDVTGAGPFTDYYYSSLAAAPLAPAGPMGVTAATDIEKLWAAYYSPSMNSQDAAALQVAIWEDIAAYVGTYTTTVSGNDPVTTEATGMLNNLPTLTQLADLQALVGPNGPGGEQSFVVAVPEPGTMALVTVGGLLLAGWAGRRQG